jgi:predicted phage terminase large subunit-like protein
MPRGGGIIQRDWWQEWAPKESPPVEFVLASLDTAIKEKEESDYYALVVLAVWRDPDTGTPKILLLNAWRDRAPLHEIVDRVVQTCRKLRVDRLVIEDKANGWVAQKEIMKQAAGWKFGISMFDPRRYGDKMARLLSVQHLFAEGMIYAPVTEDASGTSNWREWAQMVIDETSNFPRAKHDDLVDALSQGLRYLRDIGFALSKVEHQRDENDLGMHKKKSAPLYPV